MSRRVAIPLGIAGCAVLLGILLLLETTLRRLQPEEETATGAYHTLPADRSEEDPLAYLGEDFTVSAGFSSNLPIVILTLDGPLAEYKRFAGGEEIVDESAEPWTEGSLRIIGADSTEAQLNRLTDAPSYESRIRIKKRGHTSLAFDKAQYYIKACLPDGSENEAEILGMGEGHSWILNGSLADKSLMRNYLSYRICSEASGSAMAPDSRFCEVLLAREEGGCEYLGVFLLQESVARGENRVNIDQFKKKNTYTSYIVRRDRYTAFDPMLETYGRLNGYTDTWIGLKYPSDERVTPEALAFAEEDFSRIERVLYSESDRVLLSYSRCIDVASFVDYFLLNEYFGNYDAGLHSTYMYKNTGGKLMIGPVWDFDQAMNNYYMEEMDEQNIAFQTRTFFEQLVRDRRFVLQLKDRYRALREGPLSDEYVSAVMEETAAYLRSARAREWYRWAADYYSEERGGAGNYVLDPYERDGITVSRFNTDYEQELRIIRSYLTNHARYIQPGLSELMKDAKLDSSIGSYNRLLFAGFLLVLLGIGLVSKRRD